MKKVLAIGSAGALCDHENNVLADSDGNGLFFVDIIKPLAIASQISALSDHDGNALVDENDTGFAVIDGLKVACYDCDYIGGRKYYTVTLGGLEWMSENLDYKFQNLTIGASGTSASEPRANYFNNDEYRYGENGSRIGLMYNWAAVKYLNDHRESIIPGWRVPTQADWQALCNACGGPDVAGKVLKSTSGWRLGGAGTDAYDMNILPGGYYDGDFHYVDSIAQYYTIDAVESNPSQAYAWMFQLSDIMSYAGLDKTGGRYLRLVRDT